jgi:hypothetical protein
MKLFAVAALVMLSLCSCRVSVPTAGMSPITTPDPRAGGGGNSMIPSVVDRICQLVSGLVGIAAGFVLSEYAQRRREKKQSRFTRITMRMEIQQNLQTLRDLWKKIDQVDDIDQGSDKVMRAQARLFVETPLPDWRREAFHSQLPFFGVALDEGEVMRVLQFYYRLDRLEAIRDELTQKLQEQMRIYREETKPGPADFRSAPLEYDPPQFFDKAAKRLWNECESIVAQLYAKGNPLG